MTNNDITPPVCSYEGSDYQETFWERGTRAYEDACEAAALKKLLPSAGRLMLELGAGAGRNTLRYDAYQRIVLLDYSRTQLEQARMRLGDSERFVYVAADIYKLPFVEGLFDGATMIRTLHHMANPLLALQSVQNTLCQGAIFILEFANKRNTKSVLRWVLRKQKWNPFSLEPIEFAELNFDFHPKAVRSWLKQANFNIQKQLSVSHFRVGLLKNHIPLKVLVGMDRLMQWTGRFAQYSPSIFTRAEMIGKTQKPEDGTFFRCPVCSQGLPEEKHSISCPKCGHVWEYQDGIFDFRV